MAMVSVTYTCSICGDVINAEHGDLETPPTTIDLGTSCPDTDPTDSHDYQLDT